MTHGSFHCSGGSGFPGGTHVGPRRKLNSVAGHRGKDRPGVCAEMPWRRSMGPSTAAGNGAVDAGPAAAAADEEDVRREIRILSVLDHQHLIKAHDAVRFARQPREAGRGSQQLRDWPAAGLCARRLAGRTGWQPAQTPRRRDCHRADPHRPGAGLPARQGIYALATSRPEMSCSRGTANRCLPTSVLPGWWETHRQWRTMARPALWIRHRWMRSGPGCSRNVTSIRWQPWGGTA